MFVRHKHGDEENVTEFDPEAAVKSRVSRLVRYAMLKGSSLRYVKQIGALSEPFSDDRSRFKGEVTRQLPEASVYNLHWIARFVDLKAFFENTDTPIVWTLHDMNAFTGGCHFSLGCQKYTGSCGSCPQLQSKKDDDFSRRVWRRKKNLFKRSIREGRLYIVSPSEWLGREARKSSLLDGAPVKVIPYGLDTEVFSPGDRDHQRREFGLPKESDVVLFVAQSTANRRKGWSYLIRSLRRIQADDLILLSVGRLDKELDVGFEHRHLGVINDDERLAEVYSLADVFVIPSRQDNLPNTVLESMACGTPVVGFKVGGIPEMVRPGETGWLAESEDEEGLRKVIEEALGDNRSNIRARCREVAESEYNLQGQAQRYARLYGEVQGE